MKLNQVKIRVIFWTKMTFYYFSIFFYTLFFCPIFAFRGRSLHNLTLASKLYSKIDALLGLDYDVRGQQYMENDANYVVVLNHQSSLDVISLCHCHSFLRKTAFFAKSQLLYSGPFAIFGYFCNTIFIKGGSLEQTKSTLKRTFERLKCHKVKFWFYPEGARYNTGKIHKFKKGAFHFAIENKIPILPIVQSHYYFLNTDEQRFDNGNVIIEALSPISTEDLNISDVEELTQNTRELMVNAFDRINQELQVKKKLQ